MAQALSEEEFERMQVSLAGRPSKRKRGGQRTEAAAAGGGGCVMEDGLSGIGGGDPLLPSMGRCPGE